MEIMVRAVGKRRFTFLKGHPGNPGGSGLRGPVARIKKLPIAFELILKKTKKESHDGLISNLILTGYQYYYVGVVSRISLSQTTQPQVFFQKIKPWVFSFVNLCDPVTPDVAAPFLLEGHPPWTQGSSWGMGDLLGFRSSWVPKRKFKKNCLLFLF